MPLNMQDFCDNVIRRCKEPSIVDGWEYATNGVVAIRRKTDKPNSTHDWKPPLITGVFERENAIDESRLPIALPTFGPCSECEDRVFTWEEVECDECGGDGISECFECGHESECDECDGTGKTDEMVECDHCESRYTVDVNPTHMLAAKYCLLLVKNGVREIRQAADSTARFEIVDGDDHFEGLVSLKLKA